MSCGCGSPHALTEAELLSVLDNLSINIEHNEQNNNAHSSIPNRLHLKIVGGDDPHFNPIKESQILEWAEEFDIKRVDKVDECSFNLLFYSANAAIRLLIELSDCITLADPVSLLPLRASWRKIISPSSLKIHHPSQPSAIQQNYQMLIRFATSADVENQTECQLNADIRNPDSNNKETFRASQKWKKIASLQQQNEQPISARALEMDSAAASCAMDATDASSRSSSSSTARKQQKRLRYDDVWTSQPETSYSSGSVWRKRGGGTRVGKRFRQRIAEEEKHEDDKEEGEDEVEDEYEYEEEEIRRDRGSKFMPLFEEQRRQRMIWRGEDRMFSSKEETSSDRGFISSNEEEVFEEENKRAERKLRARKNISEESEQSSVREPKRRRKMLVSMQLVSDAMMIQSSRQSRTKPQERKQEEKRSDYEDTHDLKPISVLDRVGTFSACAETEESRRNQSRGDHRFHPRRDFKQGKAKSDVFSRLGNFQRRN